MPRSEGGATVPLDDVMLAMDVVDTLRHDERLALREMDEARRETELLARLTRIYASQGITVPEPVLREGVAALKESRFAYTPPPQGWKTLVARAWVQRGRVALALGALLLALGLAWFTYDAAVLAPRRAIATGAEIALTQIAETDPTPEAATRAEGLAREVRRALASGDADAASAALAVLRDLARTLPLSYELRIVSTTSRTRPRALHQRDHFVIVEAVAPDGAPLTLTIPNAEGEPVETARFALPVEEAVLLRIRRDEAGGGVLNVPPLAVKRAGEPAPDYRLPVTGPPVAGL
jgi:hypothetical protein